MIDYIFSVISTQSDVPLNQTQEKPKDTHVVMVDKVIHVSEVICKKADDLNNPNLGPQDDIESLKLQADRGHVHQKIKEHSNSQTKDKEQVTDSC